MMMWIRCDFVIRDAIALSGTMEDFVALEIRLRANVEDLGMEGDIRTAWYPVVQESSASRLLCACTLTYNSIRRLSV